MRPKLYAPQDAPWFEGVPVEKEKLRTMHMLAGMCKEAGIERKTNHSLRATGVSEMFNANAIPHEVSSFIPIHTYNMASCRTGCSTQSLMLSQPNCMVLYAQLSADRLVPS